MKKLLIFSMALSAALGSMAQVSVSLNPQAGVIGIKTSDEPSTGINTKNKVGAIVGLDGRVGGRFYFQPGVFVTTSKTLYNFKDSLFLNDDELARTSLRIKAMAGAKVYDSEHFRVRLAVGPTYDFLISLKDDGNTLIDKEEFRDGTFNLDAAVGLDFYFLTFDVGYTYGISNVWQENSNFNPNARYQGIYATLGLVFGLTESN